MNGTSASPPRRRAPGRERRHVLLAHDAAAGVAEHVLEQDLEGDRCAARVHADGEPGARERGEPVQVGEAGAEGGSGAECVGRGHALISAGGDRAMRVRPRTARYTRRVEAYRAHRGAGEGRGR